MTQETKWPAPSYDIGDLVKVKHCTDGQESMGVQKNGIYRVVGASSEYVRIMTVYGVFVPLENEQVQRWGE